jgi:hypothetical protein
MEFGEIRSDRDAFSQWLRDILADRIGRPRPGHVPRFLNKDAFLKAMATAMTALKVADKAPDAATVDNWQNGSTTPQERFVAPLFKVLFPDSSDGRTGCEQYWTRWEAASEEANAARRVPVRRPGHRHTSSAPAQQPDGPEDTEPGASDWQPVNDDPLRPGVAVLRMHAPPRRANTTKQFALKLDLAFGEWEEWLDGDQYAMLALTNAVLIPAYKGCQPEEGTQLGRKPDSHPNLECPADAWRIKGPHPVGPHLAGEPTDGEPLCSIICSGDDTDSVTVALRSTERALEVVPCDRTIEANTAKAKVLQALLQACQPKDRDGYITWGRASLKRKPRDEADR